jgi:SAM-dependent methyltransferase
MPTPRPPVESLQARAERIGGWLGGMPDDYERGGRRMFELLLHEGLTPSSRVLDVGCGALRLGYWVMRFLDPGCYCGIEPNMEMRERGLELVEPEVVARAQPRFSENDDFDLSVFGERFDFVFAGSIWTHASKEQIRAMLASFTHSSTPDGRLLASYSPASEVWRQLRTRYPRLARDLASRLPLTELSPLIARLPPRRESATEGWVGRSHTSEIGGLNKHSLHSISEEAARVGLSVQLMPFSAASEHSQSWLRVRRGSP